MQGHLRPLAARILSDQQEEHQPEHGDAGSGTDQRKPSGLQKIGLRGRLPAAAHIFFRLLHLPDKRPNFLHDLLAFFRQCHLPFRIGFVHLPADALVIDLKSVPNQGVKGSAGQLLSGIIPGQCAQMTEDPTDPLHRIAVMGQIAILAGHDETPTRRLGVGQAQYQFLNSGQHLVCPRHQSRRLGLLGRAVIQERFDTEQQSQSQGKAAHDFPVE